ncbi:MAG: DUF6334 family protein [Pyrinomonadaceae bacterium]
MMMNTISEELHNVLSEFHKLVEHPLRDVRYAWIDGCLDKIFLEFDQVSLLIEAEVDYDTIIFRVINNENCETFSSIDASHSEPWADLIGKPFGWGWVTINQQNYLDGILLSFGLVSPNLLLSVLASSITVSTINQIPDQALMAEK